MSCEPCKNRLLFIHCTFSWRGIPPSTRVSAVCIPAHPSICTDELLQVIDEFWSAQEIAIRLEPMRKTTVKSNLDGSWFEDYISALFFCLVRCSSRKSVCVERPAAGKSARQLAFCRENGSWRIWILKFACLVCVILVKRLPVGRSTSPTSPDTSMNRYPQPQ